MVFVLQHHIAIGSVLIGFGALVIGAGQLILRMINFQ